MLHKRFHCWSNPLLPIWDDYFANHPPRLLFLYPRSSYTTRVTTPPTNIPIQYLKSSHPGARGVRPKHGFPDHRVKVLSASDYRPVKDRRLQSTAAIAGKRTLSSTQAAAETSSTTEEATRTTLSASYLQGNPKGVRHSSACNADVKELDTSNIPLASSIPSDHGRKFTRTPWSTEKRTKHAANKAVDRRQLLNQFTKSTDWRIPLSILQGAFAHSGLEEPEGSEIINVPEEKLARLTGVSGSALWESKVPNGCQVEILGKGNRIDECRSIALRGTPRARDIAREIISSTISGPDKRVPTTFPWPNITFARSESRNCDRGSEEPIVRAVWTATPNVTRQIRWHEIRPPETWTASTLANYIEDLVNSNVSQSRLYESGELHAKIAETISGLFNDPNKADIIFVRALNCSLNFLYKFEMIHMVRALFLRAEELKIQMVPETFNIMLRGAAAAKDLHNFTFLLQIMIKRSVRPNSATWVAFLMAVGSKAAKLQIINIMRSTNMLQDRSILKDAAAQVISGEMVGYLKSGQGLHALLGDMDKRYGQEWLSVGAANRILHDMGGQGAISEAFELFKAMDDRFLRPDITSFNTLLGHCLYQQNVLAALRILEIMELEWTLVPDRITLDLIFKLGWNCYHYNICRVAWHYACMAGNVSYKMQKLVFRSLLQDIFTETKTIGEVWRASAGQFIVGNAISGKGQGMKSLQRDYCSSNVNVDSGLPVLPKVPDKLENEKAAGLLIKADLMSASSRQPLQPFSALLRQAWLKDTMEVNKENSMRKGAVHTLNWKVQNAVVIP
ncbi:MAG: hypothetical protein M1812_007729 [Candelaria pacifica]|nr:MAG: hypothetical protein M1812_007729 [Candelaria pacifica]